MEAAKGNRQGHRDATMVLIAFRLGLRASGAPDKQWIDGLTDSDVSRHTDERGCLFDRQSVR